MAKHQGSLRAPAWRRVALLLLYALASVQVVWFYLSRTHSVLNLQAYEQGSERTPLQYRMLMMAPLRWAHRSPLLNRWASALSTQHGWFPAGVHAEGLLQAAVDLVCIAIAGVVARELYRRVSPTGVLAPCLYPLTLVMVLSTYALLNVHTLRFVYDLPSLAFFSFGLLLIYLDVKPWWWMAVFIIGTVNRETTLLLLPFFALARCSRAKDGWDWRQLRAPSTLGPLVILSAFWLGWHHWVAAHFQANPSAAGPRLSLNLAILCLPLAWPQLLGVFAYLLPLVIVHRGLVKDPVLRAWLWVLPLWFLFMLYYGLFLEIRIFGELIPYMACMVALIAEARLTNLLCPHTAA